MHTATQRLDAAVRLLETKLDARLRALEAEVTALRLERDALFEQLIEIQGQAQQSANDDAVAALQAELEAMATAHDALLQRYNNLEQKHIVLEQAAQDALSRVDHLIAQLDIEA